MKAFIILQVVVVLATAFSKYAEEEKLADKITHSSVQRKAIKMRN